MYKTLIGQNGYLFLTNDSSHEILKHSTSIYPCNSDHILELSQIPNYLLIVYPDNSYVLREFLPPGFNPVYRYLFEKYHESLKEHIIDGYNIIKDTTEVFYKTDTHMNLKGCILILNASIERFNKLFDYNISTVNPTIIREEVDSLNSLNVGIGDLTWPINCGDQKILSTKDIYYKSYDFTNIYNIQVDGSFRLLSNKLEECTDRHIGEYVGWPILSSNILYKKNSEKPCKILIFYDSFTVPILPFLINMFGEVYLAKQPFNKILVNIINPTHIIEFRVERFLV